MSEGQLEREPFFFYSGLTALVGIAGLLAAWLVPGGNAERLGALLGAGAAELSGVVGLWLKRRVMNSGIEAALKMVGLVFGLRVVLVGVGLFWLARRGGGAVAFVVGFFALYFVLQWIEISYVLAEQKRRGRGQ